MNKQGANNQSTIIEDLNAEISDEIKGGPKRIFIGGLSVKTAQAELTDLEPSGEVNGGAIYMKVEGVKGR